MSLRSRLKLPRVLALPPTSTAWANELHVPDDTVCDVGTSACAFMPAVCAVFVRLTCFFASILRNRTKQRHAQQLGAQHARSLKARCRARPCACAPSRLSTRNTF